MEQENTTLDDLNINMLSEKFNDVINKVLLKKDEEVNTEIKKQSNEICIRNKNKNFISEDFKYAISAYNRALHSFYKDKDLNPNKLLNLKMLSYNYNFLITKLSKIKILNLSSANLDRIPFNALKHMKSLDRLDFSNNPRIGSSSAPDDVNIKGGNLEFCKTLKILLFNGSKLKKIPRFI